MSEKYNPKMINNTSDIINNLYNNLHFWRKLKMKNRYNEQVRKKIHYTIFLDFFLNLINYAFWYIRTVFIKTFGKHFSFQTFCPIIWLYSDVLRDIWKNKQSWLLSKVRRIEPIRSRTRRWWKCWPQIWWPKRQEKQVEKPRILPHLLHVAL